jgi:signal transduction histidine kinase
VGAVDEQSKHPVHLSRAGPIGAAIAVPLAGQYGPQGAIVAGRLKGRRPFTSADLDMAETFSKHAAIARELAEARAHRHRLELLEDRDRIARDLHDHVIQRLFASGLTIQSVASIVREQQPAARLSRVVDDLDITIRQIRQTIFQLQEADHPHPGVRSTVLDIVRQVTPALGFEPTMRFSGPLDTLIPATAFGSVGAVVREALTNVARHAHSTEVVVEMSVDSQRLVVQVSDDGVGLGDGPRRSGLANLTRRAEIWGGKLSLTPNEPQGTRFQWTIPLPN